MKEISRLFLLFVLVMAMSSCSSNENSLTKENVLEYLKQYEAKQPIVFKNRMQPFFIKLKEELQNASNSYYSNLYNEGYIKAELRTDIPNPESSPRPYQVVLTEKAEPFILEKNATGVVNVITLEFNAVDVKEIRIVSDFKAKVDVVYKKTKTPFHNANGKDVAGSGKEYPNDTHVKTLEFKKNQSINEWKYPIKIIF